MNPSTINLCGISESQEKSIKLYLYNCGIPPLVKGYSYILVALSVMIDNNYTLDDAYTEVAIQYWTTSRRVEQAIRHAIEISWSWEGERSLKNIYPSEQIPTNEEFLLLLQMSMLQT